MATIEIDRATGLVASAAYKAPCYLATTANITLAGEQTIDGVLTSESRVLVKDQTDATQNGIYISSTGEWQRAPDFSRNEQIAEGTRVWVTDGTASAQTEYVVTTSDPIELDTSSITFTSSSPALAATQIGTAIHSATATTTLDDADEVGIWDSVTGLLRKITGANLKAALKTYFDTLYTTAAAVAAAYLPLSAVATAAQYLANTASKVLTTDKVWSAAAEVTLTDAATVAFDQSSGINFKVTLGGNRTMGQPSSTINGKTGRIIVKQDATGSRTLTWHADFEFASSTAPTLSTAAGAEDVFYYDQLAANRTLITGPVKAVG